MNGCYKVVNRRLEWSIAGLECRSLHKDAHLLIINDAAEQSAIAAMLDSIHRQFKFFQVLIQYLRDAMQSAVMPQHVVCLSVRLSVRDVQVP